MMSSPSYALHRATLADYLYTRDASRYTRGTSHSFVPRWSRWRPRPGRSTLRASHSVAPRYITFRVCGGTVKIKQLPPQTPQTLVCALYVATRCDRKHISSVTVPDSPMTEPGSIWISQCSSGSSLEGHAGHWGGPTSASSSTALPTGQPTVACPPPHSDDVLQWATAGHFHAPPTASPGITPDIPAPLCPEGPLISAAQRCLATTAQTVHLDLTSPLAQPGGCGPRITFARQTSCHGGQYFQTRGLHNCTTRGHTVSCVSACVLFASCLRLHSNS